MKAIYSAPFNTLRRAGMRRIAHRLFRRLRTRAIYPWLGISLFPFSSEFMDPPEGAAALNDAAWGFPSRPEGRMPEDSEADQLSGHTFSFLNLPPQSLGSPVDWQRLPGGDRLWQTCLHSGDWAPALARTYLDTLEDRFRDALIGLMADWIEHNPVGKEPGWEPYSVSRRLIAWSRAAAALWGDAQGQRFWKESLGPSLRQQARFLAANQEKDLANNHLLANFRALAWMGLLFPKWPEAFRWRKIGLQGLWQEMRRQVLSDGGHDERSITYHALVLRDLLETWGACVSTGEPAPEEVVPTIEKMVHFLDRMQAPDGTYPLWNDSVSESSLDPQGMPQVAGFAMGNEERFLRNLQGGGVYAGMGGISPDHLPAVKGRVEQPSLSVFPQAGFCVLRPGAEHFLYFDAGPMGPAHLPGHGHADALSLLLFAGGRWLIADPGVFSYHDREWRNHFRSTPAHNTVTMDGQDQCVFWGPFRVAHPPTARMIDWGEGRVAGEHEGYARLGEPVIHRRIVRQVGPGEYEVRDCFSGRGNHDFLFNLQFAVGAEGEVVGQNGEFRWPEGVSLTVSCLTPPPGAAARVEAGWVSSSWNLKEEAPRYVLRWRGKVPLENRVIIRIRTEV